MFEARDDVVMFMTVALLAKKTKIFGPESNGILMTPLEFDRAEFDENWRFELINGVLIVTPLPRVNESDPNEELGRLLRNYKFDHPEGASLDATLAERTIATVDSRRSADRVIWAGLGRLPRKKDTPTIVAEFVSGRKRDRKRDYETKRLEYLGIGVKEHWVFDRFTRTLTVFARIQGRQRTRVFAKKNVYRTDPLSGFEVPLAHLFELADQWGDDQPE